MRLSLLSEMAFDYFATYVLQEGWMPSLYPNAF